MTVEPWWIWMFLAATFLIGEIRRMGSFCLWLSLAAAISGILALLDIPTAGQAAVFINMSGIMIVLERRFYERYTFKKPQLHPDIHPPGSREGEKAAYIFRQRGGVWEIEYGGTSCPVKTSIGLQHIRNLIRCAGEWMHCSDLKRLTLDVFPGEKFIPYRDMTQEELDLENLKRLEEVPPEDIIRRLPLQKIKELRDEIVEKRDSGNFESPEEKIDQLNMLEIIENYLDGVSDIKGRSRKLYDETENDRKAVSAAINRARKSLIAHKELYTHLKSFIQAEGNSFRYLPDRPIDWLTD